MKFVIFFLVLSSLQLLQVNSYCIYNSSYQIKVQIKDGTWKIEGKLINNLPYWIVNPAKKQVQRIVPKNEHMCCVWNEIRLPRGGYLDIKQSIFPNKDNWIEVHGHLNDDLGYWYRCGYRWQHND
ncbi:unnamed protein product [Brachionus calyciflorus]|uniref:Uncharacterized protein n=1 Tax=Brachionus calyciflorus TaxID=104777 RepID=A0A814E5D0_9BILA|nr:unnamed protein product [Brachionus calyciflorus]